MSIGRISNVFATGCLPFVVFGLWALPTLLFLVLDVFWPMGFAVYFKSVILITYSWFRSKSSIEWIWCKFSTVYCQIESWHRPGLTELVSRYAQLNKLCALEIIAAIDINNQESSGYLNNVGRKIRHQAISRGVLLHSHGNVLYISNTCWNWIRVGRQIDSILGELLDR